MNDNQANINSFLDSMDEAPADQFTAAETLLTLQTPQNEIISGYMLGTPELHEGQIIHKLRLEEKNSPQHGKYNIIHGFEKVA